MARELPNRSGGGGGVGRKRLFDLPHSHFATSLPIFGVKPETSTVLQKVRAHDVDIVSDAKSWPIKSYPITPNDQNAKSILNLVPKGGSFGPVRLSSPATRLQIDDPSNAALLRWDRLSEIDRFYTLEKILYLLNSHIGGSFSLAPISAHSDGVTVISTLCNLLAEAKTNISRNAFENMNVSLLQCIILF